jgi:ATP-binding cassette, subfamily B, bacterial
MTKDRQIDRATLRIFWQEGLKDRRELWLALLHPLAGILLGLLVPLFVGKTLAAMASPDVEATKYLPYFIASAVVGIVCNRLGFASLLRYQARTMGRLQAKALETLLRRSTGFHNNHVGGKLVSDAIDFPTAFSLISTALFVNLIPFVILLIVGPIIVMTESLWLGLLTLLIAAYALGSGIYESRKRAPVRAARLKASKAVTAHTADTIVNVQTVKTFAREESELSEHYGLNKTLTHMRLRDWVDASNKGNRRIIVLLTAQLLFVLLAIRLVEQDPELLGIGIFAFSFSILISNRLFEVNTLLRNIEEGFLQASPLTEIMLEKPEIQDAPGAKTLQVTEGEIALKDVDFKYNDSQNTQAVFRALNLRIKSGEKVGLVGPSGGGKSTLTRLLLRFEDIEKGTISIDGQDIAAVTQDSLRRAIAYVPQEPLLFHRTIRENIAYGNPDASLAAIRKAASLAHADDFIKGLANGYDTVVGERGVKLSGGQRQRVAIARAILKDAPILVLDEATSALDSESEKLIQSALWELMKGRTAIVIAHRLSTIQKMDRIIVLDDGKIVEEGTHKTLLKHDGTYARLWSHQSGGFIEE